MTAQAVRDAVDELTRWLPAAQALTAQPDADGTRGRGQPSSRPPWNGAAAHALLDAVEGARRLEAAWRSGRRRPVSATGAVLASIVRLSYAVTEDEQHQAVILVGMWTRSILQLPAIGKAERPLRLAAECPYCRYFMMCAYPVSGRVACLRGAGKPPLCQDADGNPPRGQMGYSQLDGSPQVNWDDGLVT